MPDSRQWRVAAVIIVAMVGLQLVGPEYLRYDTRLIHEFELWRLLSGHWVHANWVHLALNMAGFCLCILLTEIQWSWSQWLWRIVTLSAAISAAFLLLNPQIGWYVGFSGVLFGLYVLAAAETLPRQRYMSLLILVFIVIKIAMEQGASVKITSAELIGVPVLVDAHLYGVLSAFLIFMFQWTLKRSRNSSEK